MAVTSNPLMALTADDLMTRNVIQLQADMPLREAARLLLDNQIGGAPVVDADGCCIGVLSAVDFLRLAGRRADVSRPVAPPLLVTCGFQSKSQTADGREVIRCTLPPGVCPVQVKQQGPDGEELLVCSEPHCVLVDWQVVHLEKLPVGAVRQFMTADPVTVRPTTSLRAIARMMIDAHIHRLIVVDEEHRPVGVLTSTDLLAALAYAEGEP